MMKSAVERETENADKEGFLQTLRNQEFSARSTHLLASCELSLDSVTPNTFYKSWESMLWAAQQPQQRRVQERLILALPPPPSLHIALLCYQPHREINEQTGLKLQRSMHCQLPSVANFSDPLFSSQEELVETMMVSQREVLRDELATTLNDPLQSDWLVNQNYPIIMPPYHPISVKLNPLSSLAKQPPETTQHYKSTLPQEVPRSVQDIDPFQQELIPEDLAFLGKRYIGDENMEPLLQALSHEGPNYEENRKYWGKLKEYVQLKWKKEEIAPSRLVPVSLKHLLSIILLRSQFTFTELGCRLLELTHHSKSSSILYEEACIFVEQICRRLMVPIAGFQLRNWVQSTLFNHSPQIIKAAIISNKASLTLSSPQVDVTSILQRYLNFCRERLGSSLLFLPGLAVLSEFKAALKKLAPPRLLVVSFSNIRGDICSEAFVITAAGQIQPKEALQDCLIWNSYFSLEGVRQRPTSLDSLLTLPYLSDWLRMEVSLSSTKSKPKVLDLSLQIRVDRANKIFYFTRGLKRVLQLPQANIQHISQKCELGQLLEVDTLSDLRYRIRRYFRHTQDIEQLKELQSYIFTEQHAQVLQIDEFTHLGRLFQHRGDKIVLHLNYAREEIRGEVQQQSGQMGYALFLNGDGSSTFKKCRVLRDQKKGEQQLYKIKYGEEREELRTRKEIILQEYDRRDA